MKVKYEVVSTTHKEWLGGLTQQKVNLLYKGDGTHWSETTPSCELVVSASMGLKPGDFVYLTLEKV